MERRLLDEGCCPGGGHRGASQRSNEEKTMKGDCVHA